MAESPTQTDHQREPVPPRRIARRDEGAGKVIAIIGAGFSGTMAAVHLRQTLPPEYLIYLFDRTGRFARGPAYAASGIPHLLNVRSANMSAFPADPGHFDRWMATQIDRAPGETALTEAGSFATRRLYGRYLRALLYEEMLASGGRVRLGSDDVTGLVRQGDGWLLTCASGRSVAADGVVLAAGNLPSDRPCDGVVFHDPWAADATAGLRAETPVLVVGTGLTMVDLVLGMQAKGFAGQVIALSRRGLVPQAHKPAGPPWPAPDFTAQERCSLPALLRRVRTEIAAASRQGTDWRAVIDGLRPVTAELWRGLPPGERDRFLRHLRPYWDVHRHRTAPVVADRFAALVASGAIRLERGRVLGTEKVADEAVVTLQRRGEPAVRQIRVQRVIHATGAGFTLPDQGLIGRLVQAGQVRTDANGLGLDVSAGLEVLDGAGLPSGRLWALGPIIRGVFWECTAVPDIRVQAATIAAAVAREVMAPEP